MVWLIRDFGLGCTFVPMPWKSDESAGESGAVRFVLTSNLVKVDPASLSSSFEGSGTRAPSIPHFWTLLL